MRAATRNDDEETSGLPRTGDDLLELARRGFGQRIAAEPGEVLFLELALVGDPVFPDIVEAAAGAAPMSVTAAKPSAANFSALRK